MGTKKTNVLDRFDQIELEHLMHDPEHVKEFICQEGYDLEKIMAIGLKKITQTQFLLSANVQKNTNLALFEEAFIKLKTMFNQNIQQATDLITQLQRKTPNVQYRKLEQWSEDEIRSVLSDIDLIELMEKLSDQDNHGK